MVNIISFKLFESESKTYEEIDKDQMIDHLSRPLYCYTHGEKNQISNELIKMNIHPYDGSGEYWFAFENGSIKYSKFKTNQYFILDKREKNRFSYPLNHSSNDTIIINYPDKRLISFPDDLPSFKKDIDGNDIDPRETAMRDINKYMTLPDYSLLCSIGSDPWINKPFHQGTGIYAWNENFLINKCDDEWFIIEHWIDSWYENVKFYRCDQLSGFFDLLKNRILFRKNNK